MFIKYVLIPLRMDKKKDIEKHSFKHGARETTRRQSCYFCIVLCQFNKGVRTHSTSRGWAFAREERRKKTSTTPEI